MDLDIPGDCIEHVEDAHLMLDHLITKELRERAATSPAAVS